MNHEEVYVCWIQDYDISYPIGVVTKDKFEDFIKSYEDKEVKKNNENIENIEIIRDNGAITWLLKYNLEYTKKIYPMLTEEQIVERWRKDRSWGCNYKGFNFDLIKINKLY